MSGCVSVEEESHLHARQLHDIVIRQLPGLGTNRLAVDERHREGVAIGLAVAGIVNLLAVGGNQQVMIEVTVSEMSRDLRKAIGTNFAAEIVSDGKEFFFFNGLDGLASLESLTRTAIRDEAGDVIGDVIESTINFSDQLNFVSQAPIGSGVYTFFVRALDESGLGKILAEPTLVALSHSLQPPTRKPPECPNTSTR